MATNANFISATVADAQRILDLIEEAQGVAAARAQEWSADITGGMVLTESDFDGLPYTLAQFNDVQTALAAMPSILGGWAVVYYRVKE